MSWFSVCWQAGGMRHDRPHLKAQAWPQAGMGRISPGAVARFAPDHPGADTPHREIPGYAARSAWPPARFRRQTQTSSGWSARTGIPASRSGKTSAHDSENGQVAAVNGCEPARTACLVHLRRPPPPPAAPPARCRPAARPTAIALHAVHDSPPLRCRRPVLLARQHLFSLDHFAHSQADKNCQLRAHRVLLSEYRLSKNPA